jgi:hypothetical protein
MSRQHTLAKLVHRLGVFGHEDTEWLFALQLDRFESDDEEILGPQRMILMNWLR